MRGIAVSISIIDSTVLKTVKWLTYPFTQQKKAPIVVGAQWVAQAAAGGLGDESSRRLCHVTYRIALDEL